eukprot:g2743.t1
MDFCTLTSSVSVPKTTKTADLAYPSATVLRAAPQVMIVCSACGHFHGSAAASGGLLQCRGCGRQNTLIRRLQLTLTLAVDTAVTQAIMFEEAVAGMLRCTPAECAAAAHAGDGCVQSIADALEGVHCSVVLCPRKKAGMDRDPKIVRLVPHDPFALSLGGLGGPGQ